MWHLEDGRRQFLQPTPHIYNSAHAKLQIQTQLQENVASSPQAIGLLLQQDSREHVHPTVTVHAYAVSS